MNDSRATIKIFSYAVRAFYRQIRQRLRAEIQPQIFAGALIDLPQ